MGFTALKKKYLCDSLSHLPGENRPAVTWFFITEDSQPLAKFTPSDRKQPCLQCGGRGIIMGATVAAVRERAEVVRRVVHPPVMEVLGLDQ